MDLLHNCEYCLFFGQCDSEESCEHFCPAGYTDDTYMEMMQDIYNEYREDYWNYLKEFNR